MNKEQKFAVSGAFSEKIRGAKAIILAEYRGLKVSQLTEIRREFRKNDCELKVVKNRLAKKAMEGSEWAVLDGHMKGPLAIAIAMKDPVVLAKTLTKFAESNEALKLRAGCLNGKVLNVKEIDALSKLPSKEELYAKMLGTLLAPIQGVVRTLNGVPQKLAIALKEISQKKAS
ncbi:MAG: 50S ribosomal protein L10 [Deltaproteobacteria bacterium]|nr:MAG: 50S ribosomal protein L10 [Deltaproteobacteria bacterium]